MLLFGLGASAAACAALLLPILLYHYFVDSRKSNTLAAFTFCCTLTSALLLALLVPLDIVLSSSTGSLSVKTVEEVNSPLAPSLAEAAAAAHASNVSSAFTPAGAAAAAAAAAGWAALKSATLSLTSEHLQRMYSVLGLAVFFCCFVLTPAAIFYATELNKRQARSCVTFGHEVDEYDSPPCDVLFPTLKKTCYFVLGLGALLLVLLSLRPGMPSPSFIKPGEVLEEPRLIREQQQQQSNDLEKTNLASIMAAAAAAASAAAATATEAATRAAAAAGRVDSEAVQLYTAQLLGVQKAAVWTVFGAFGLVALPFKWLRRGASTQQQQREVQQKIASLRDQQRRLQSKYAGNMSAMTFTDKERLEMLKAQQCFCTERNYKLQEAEQGRRPAYSVLCRLMLPFRRTVGLSLLSLLLLMLFSLGTYPPADLWLVCCWLLLLLFGGLCGLLEILPRCLEAHKGASELKQHLQSVRGGGSSPQVLLVLSALLAHHILAAGLCIFTVAPQYASFGNQSFVPQNGSDAIRCSLHAAASGNTCQPTIFAAALSRVAFVGSLLPTAKRQLHRLTIASSPMLATISYCSDWAFLVVAVSCLVYFAFFHWRSPNASRPQQSIESAEDLEDMAAVDESARLLGV
ncbi:hypothetical protein Emag_004652 [Eimeria magna]